LGNVASIGDRFKSLKDQYGANDKYFNFQGNPVYANQNGFNEAIADSKDYVDALNKLYTENESLLATIEDKHGREYEQALYTKQDLIKELVKFGMPLSDLGDSSRRMINYNPYGIMSIDELEHPDTVAEGKADRNAAFAIATAKKMNSIIDKITQ